MKKINLRKIVIVLMLIVTCLSACGNSNNSETNSAYEYGTFTGDIKDKFEIVDGSESGKAIAGVYNTVYINYAYTTDGGIVVWKDSNYGYTSEDVSAASMCSSFALHFEYIESISK